MTLHDAVQSRSVEAVKDLLTDFIEVNGYVNARTPLHLAVLNGDLEICKLLLEAGADCNLKDRITEATVGHYCAVYNHLSVAKLLLANSLNVAMTDQYGNEPLWTATFNVKGNMERLDMIILFIKNGGDPNHKNHSGRSPLDFAKQINSQVLIELLENQLQR